MTELQFFSVLVLCLLAAAPLQSSNDHFSPSSPGWKQQPHDVAASLGSSVTFRCITNFHYRGILWTINGKVVGGSYGKLQLHHQNKVAVYGPLDSSDEGVLVGCRVRTSFGLLPSHVGKITIKVLPVYKPVKVQTASLGEPYDFDFGYTLSTPPLSFSWTKNGRPFTGVAGRVAVTHEGIMFTRVLIEDAGSYVVMATNKAGSASASAALKVLSFKNAKSNNNNTLSLKLAIFLALEQNNYDSSVFHTVTDPNSHASKYSQRVIELFHRFKKPSSSSRKGGLSRLRIEQLLLTISKLVHKNNIKVSDKDMAILESFTNCTASLPKPLCTNLDLHYRTIDGTCNNFFYPLNGAAGTALARILPAMYEDGISAPVGQRQLLLGRSFSPPWPSARYVSSRVIRTLPEVDTGELTHMVMQWGQFVDHDLDISPVFDEDECDCKPTLTCIPIRVSPDDPVFGKNSPNNGDCLTFSRSVPTCSSGKGKGMPRNQVNDLTSYIDASNVYGSSKKLADELRLFKAGLLKQGGRLESLKGNLPVQEDAAFNGVPLFVAGDERVNEQIGLTIMHTVWLREHNRIARRLMEINPCWNDQRLYEETRKIVGAIQQIISFTEFLPTLYGPHFSTYFPPYAGYNPFVDATIPNSFSAAAFRVGHSLIRSQFERLDRDYRRLDIGPLPLRNAFNNPLAFYESLGTDPILRGLTVVKANPVDEFLNIVLTSQLFAEEGDDLGMDLASLNIQRGRDHGLPSYRQWEKFCRRVYPNMKATFTNDFTERTLREVYGPTGFEEGIDLWVGGLSEKRLAGAHLGPTFACILAITFTRARDGDRFWYQNPRVFRSWQRRELQKATLAKVVCTNGDDIPTIQKNVFGDGPRVSCSSIPEINLLFWRDNTCIRGHRYYG